jgi:hypothetical protein
MTYEVVSTRSWNVLGTFDQEDAARAAVASSMADHGAGIHDLVVYVSDDSGHPVGEYGEEQLVSWADVGHHARAGSTW